MRCLVWFRVDLRTRDNPALLAASARATRGCVAVCLLAPEMWRRHDEGGVKIDFILRSLRHLSSELDRLRIGLCIRQAPAAADAPEALLRLAREHDCDALYFNRQLEINERHRDQRVQDAFESERLAVEAFDEQTILPPGAVRTKEGGFFSVYTPFRKAWLAAARDGADIDPSDRPRAQPERVCEPDPVPERIEGFDSPIDAALWPAGERVAHERLDAFCAGPISEYHTDRDRLDREGTSRLSPYLAQGVLSLRQCLRAARDANAGRFEGGAPGAEKWLSELLWREFYRHLLDACPRVSMGRASKPETDRLRWRRDEDDFQRWTQGRTGFPVVDAAMRCLLSTGWMHNRARMIVAMFLTKDLSIDWRWGERWFMRRLIDADLSNNNGGWQWAASTGADAQPYFRIFNPTKQSHRHDPDGAFIRRWVPELADLPAPSVHDPSPFDRARLGYPEPMVDHAAARERALAAFRSLRSR